MLHISGGFIFNDYNYYQPQFVVHKYIEKTGISKISKILVYLRYESNVRVPKLINFKNIQ